MKTIEQIYTDFPELEEIAMRLDDSEKEAIAKNKERRSNKNEPADFQMSSDKKKRTLSVNAEVSRISDFYKDKRWNATSYISKPGRKEFEAQLMRVVETRNPDAIKVKVFPSNRELTCRLEKTVWLNKEEFTDTADKQETSTNRSLGAVETAIEQLKKDFAENNKQGANNTIDFNTQMQIINLQHAQNLKDIQHAQEIEKLKRDHDDKIRQYQQELDNRDNTIEELEEELADVEDSLNGIEDKIEAAKNPNYVDIAAKVVSKGIENLAKDNKKLIGDFLGMSESDLDGYFKDKEEKSKQIATPNTSTASYSTEASTIDSFSHLDTEKRQFAESLTAMVSTMSIENLRVIVTIIQLSTNEDGTLNNIAEELLKKAYELNRENKEQ